MLHMAVFDKLVLYVMSFLVFEAASILIRHQCIVSVDLGLLLRHPFNIFLCVFHL